MLFGFDDRLKPLYRVAIPSHIGNGENYITEDGILGARTDNDTTHSHVSFQITYFRKDLK